jgi:hypothetical protein
MGFIEETKTAAKTRSLILTRLSKNRNTKFPGFKYEETAVLRQHMGVFFLLSILVGVATCEGLLFGLFFFFFLFFFLFFFSSSDFALVRVRILRYFSCLDVPFSEHGFLLLSVGNDGHGASLREHLFKRDSVTDDLGVVVVGLDWFKGPSGEGILTGFWRGAEIIAASFKPDRSEARKVGTCPCMPLPQTRRILLVVVTEPK